MSGEAIRPDEGRRLFGGDSAAYERGRRAYPARVYELIEQAGSWPGARVLDVGAGTGLATLELVRRGAGSIVAVEPDARMARELRRNVAARAASAPGARGTEIEVVEAAF